MSRVKDNPVKSIKKLNFITFTLLLISVLIYQSTLLLQHQYIVVEGNEFGLANLERLLTQKIGKNLSASLTAPDDFSRNRYINNARQDINSLFSNHHVLLEKSIHFRYFHGNDELTRNVYEEADIYLQHMRDAVLAAAAVAETESYKFNAFQQQSLSQSVEKYLKNQQLFLNLVEQASNLSAIHAKSYMTQLPWLSWCLVGLILLVMVFNHRLIYRRTVLAAKTQFKELEQRMEFQEALLSSEHNVIITLSTQGFISLFSPSATRMFGYSVEEITGKNICDLMSENACPYAKQCRSNLTDFTCHLVHKPLQELEVEGMTKKGKTFPLLLEIEELKTPNQHIFIGCMRDLTLEKEAEFKLLQAKQSAEEANQAKSQFLSNITHELKTPLNAILGFSQLLETDDNSPLNSEQMECVQHIYNAGKLLLALVNDVLDLSKIETGNVHLEISEVSVNEIILEALNLIQHIAKENNIRIKTRFDPLADTIINVDGLRFKQILLNLLSNAVKYNSENGLITLRSKVENNRVKISVKDTGKGIDEGKLMDLFQPFNRLGAEKTGIEGTGIGLCIAKRLVERMGGTIGVMNNKDVGCCFWVEFPIVPYKNFNKRHVSALTQKVQNEFEYLQESLNIIGLVKNHSE